MRQATLVFVFSPDNHILLAMKKRGFGACKWNGAGGKVESDESIVEAAARELREETGVVIPIDRFEDRGLLHFRFPEKPEWDLDVTVFVSYGYVGDIIETEEMKPEWFQIGDIPYDEMWDDDRYWLPRVIAGERVHYEMRMGADGHMLEAIDLGVV